jgi:hypothetical protein
MRGVGASPTVRDPSRPFAPRIRRFGADPNAQHGTYLQCTPWLSPGRYQWKSSLYISALVLSMILALIPFAVIAVNDSAAVRAEATQAA